ncbi:MAG: ATPase [Ruminococcaceae bacterium]|nr:ATPase [Oscillospiraceae bacterium]
MIVPMKKITLIAAADKKTKTLKKLRGLGLMHVEITEGSGERLDGLARDISLMDNALYFLGDGKSTEQKAIDSSEALDLANKVISLTEERKELFNKAGALEAELESFRDWGDIDPELLKELEEKNIKLGFYQMPLSEYKALSEKIRTVRLDKTKAGVKLCIMESDGENDSELLAALRQYRLTLPVVSTKKMAAGLADERKRIEDIDKELLSYSAYVNALKKARGFLEGEAEFETYATGMSEEELSQGSSAYSICYFTGYVEAENVDKLKQAATENKWGLICEEPCPEDKVPTKLKNNRFVSLIYPLTDFLGTVPGYFEYDISAWFLMFILIFFGIIFGDGGYGLLICGVAAVPIIGSIAKKKPVQPMMLLIGLFGLATVLWGTLTCTWFGISPEYLPHWLKALSVPVISNVYADTLWTLPWTESGVGLTTSQNVQILCFTLALIQLSVAHLMGAARNRRSVRMLGDIGSVLQLLGMYYLVLSLVVNPQVFSFGLVIGGIPVGTVTLGLIGLGFVMSFVFSNYESSIGKSIAASMKNIVSVLLGVVNVFSDIVSYIRLWAVGLAGAAISATVNEMAGPFLGNLMFMVFAIILLVFGHGLNMILNVLSVIVHGIRLNTLEFSSHLDMSWSGHKFKAFKE